MLDKRIMYGIFVNATNNQVQQQHQQTNTNENHNQHNYSET